MGPSQSSSGEKLAKYERAVIVWDHCDKLSQGSHILIVHIMIQTIVLDSQSRKTTCNINQPPTDFDIVGLLLFICAINL